MGKNQDPGSKDSRIRNIAPMKRVKGLWCRVRGPCTSGTARWGVRGPTPGSPGGTSSWPGRCPGWSLFRYLHITLLVYSVFKGTVLRERFRKLTDLGLIRAAAFVRIFEIFLTRQSFEYESAFVLLCLSNLVLRIRIHWIRIQPVAEHGSNPDLDKIL